MADDETTGAGEGPKATEGAPGMKLCPVTGGKLEPRTGKPWQEVFLAELAKHRNIRLAAAAAGVNRSTVYELKDRDPAFADRMQDALEDAADVLEQEAWRRAVEGFTQEVFQGGKLVGTVQQFSDRLLAMLLRAARPERFQPEYRHRHEHTVRRPPPTPEQMAADLAPYVDLLKKVLPGPRVIDAGSAAEDRG